MSFLEIASKRRSVYDLGKDSSHSIEDVVAQLRQVMDRVPTAFNSQTSRLVVVSGEDNVKLWDYIYDVQKDVLSQGMLDQMGPVMQAAKEGLGTILFFEDLDQVKEMPTQGERTTAYKFTNNGNHQFAAWLTLADMGLGASLQHFNIGYDQGFDKGVRDLFDLPDTYEMVAQMPFGSIESPAASKSSVDPETKVQFQGK